MLCQQHLLPCQCLSMSPFKPASSSLSPQLVPPHDTCLRAARTASSSAAPRSSSFTCDPPRNGCSAFVGHLPRHIHLQGTYNMEAQHQTAALPGRCYCKTEQVKTTKLDKLCVHINELHMVSASATKLIADAQQQHRQCDECC